MNLSPKQQKAELDDLEKLAKKGYDVVTLVERAARLSLDPPMSLGLERVP